MAPTDYFFFTNKPECKRGFIDNSNQQKLRQLVFHIELQEAIKHVLTLIDMQTRGRTETMLTCLITEVMSVENITLADFLFAFSYQLTPEVSTYHVVIIYFLLKSGS